MMIHTFVMNWNCDEHSWHVSIYDPSISQGVSEGTTKNSYTLQLSPLPIHRLCLSRMYFKSFLVCSHILSSLFITIKFTQKPNLFDLSASVLKRTTYLQQRGNTHTHFLSLSLSLYIYIYLFIYLYTYTYIYIKYIIIWPEEVPVF
jgi:hypothetical protein